MPGKCLCLYSGGLDSRLVIKLMVKLGFEVIAFHGLHCFESRQLIPGIEEEVRKDCMELGATEVVCKDLTSGIFELIKDNKYGLGKNLNPCTDCRISTISAGFDVMRQVGADFMCSGEVVGQRPKSQQRNAMNCILNRLAELGGDGLLLRPLSAQLLEETIPEKQGLVNRDDLFDFSGRSRYDQIALAEELGVKDFPAPAGGCLLTDIGYSARLDELMKYEQDIMNNDLDLLKFGRHYRAANGAKIISSRNGDEGDIIEALAKEGDTFYISDPLPGAFIFVRGEVDNEVERVACGLAVYYSKYRQDGKATILKYNNSMSMEDGKKLIDCDVVKPEDITDLIVKKDEYLAAKKERDSRYQQR